MLIEVEPYTSFDHNYYGYVFL